MIKEKFKFIRVDSKYINYLIKFDKKVQYNDEVLKKLTKPFLGILFKINNQNYYVPLSSANKNKKLVKMYEDYKK